MYYFLQVQQPNMNLPLGITLTFLLILQTFQQVSSQVQEEWKRDNMAADINETQSSSQKPPVSIAESVDNAEGSSEGEGESFGSFILTKVDEQNSTTQPDHMDNDTEDASSGEAIATTPPPMIALNSSSDPSNTSAESTAETQTEETTTNTSTPEPEHTNQSALNYTYTSPKPETNTTDSSFDESGSGYLPPDDVPTNSTTKSPATTTKDESVQYKSTVSPTEPPVYRTTPEFPPAIPENITTPAPESENTEADLAGPFDNKDNSERGKTRKSALIKH